MDYLIPICYTEGKNIIGAPKIQNNYGAIKHYYIEFYGFYNALALLKYE